jgi:hypothetical protein
MKTLRAILSKGPDDFGAWLENFEGVYGAGATVAEAKRIFYVALHYTPSIIAAHLPG